MSATPADKRVAKRIADDIKERGADRTPWKRVATLRYLFDMEGVVFSRRQRERMQAALEQAGLEPDPPIGEVGRNSTVKLRPRAGSGATKLGAQSAVGAAVAPVAPAAVGARQIFLSYRREDCQAQANGLNDGLRMRIQDADVFMDIDTIPPGTDFEEFIHSWIANSDVVLVLVGDNWLDRDRNGERRIDHPDDFVRLEVRAAFELKRTVIPILVEGAEMPSSSELPDDIARLARIQAFELSDKGWIRDLDALVRVLREMKPKVSDPVQRPDPAAESAVLDPVIIEFPSRFTDLWFRTNVPAMNQAQLDALREELYRRNWTEGEITDHALCHADENLLDLREDRGSAENAKPFDMPSRITTSWCKDNVPDLDEDQLALLLQVLRRRGWTEGELTDHVYYWREGH